MAFIDGLCTYDLVRVLATTLTANNTHVLMTKCPFVETYGSRIRGDERTGKQSLLHDLLRLDNRRRSLDTSRNEKSVDLVM
jgi:hypothetical protein